MHEKKKKKIEKEQKEIVQMSSRTVKNSNHAQFYENKKG